jgi:hypothetical protein
MNPCTFHAAVEEPPSARQGGWFTFNRAAPCCGLIDYATAKHGTYLTRKCFSASDVDHQPLRVRPKGTMAWCWYFFYQVRQRQECKRSQFEKPTTPSEITNVLIQRNGFSASIVCLLKPFLVPLPSIG